MIGCQAISHRIGCYWYEQKLGIRTRKNCLASGMANATKMKGNQDFRNAKKVGHPENINIALSGIEQNADFPDVLQYLGSKLSLLVTIESIASYAVPIDK
jgi:hypothetical protein